MSTKQSAEHLPPDPLIDEVRGIRRKISNRFGNDIGKLVEHLREIERRYPGRVVRPRAAKKSTQPAGE